MFPATNGSRAATLSLGSMTVASCRIPDNTSRVVLSYGYACCLFIRHRDGHFTVPMRGHRCNRATKSGGQPGAPRAEAWIGARSASNDRQSNACSIPSRNPPLLPAPLTSASTNDGCDRSRTDIGESSSKQTPENQTPPRSAKLSKQ
jgi:hypothetical protein